MDKFSSDSCYTDLKTKFLREDFRYYFRLKIETLKNI